MKRFRVFISGRVQGVFFRIFTQKKAKSLGLSGWAKNLPDGRVEAVFEGEPKMIKQMLNWCDQGSPASQVDKIERLEEEPEGLERFEIEI